jgi:hypothetical protein
MFYNGDKKTGPFFQNLKILLSDIGLNVLRARRITAGGAAYVENLAEVLNGINYALIKEEQVLSIELAPAPKTSRCCVIV